MLLSRRESGTCPQSSSRYPELGGERKKLDIGLGEGGRVGGCLAVCRIHPGKLQAQYYLALNISD